MGLVIIGLLIFLVVGLPLGAAYWFFGGWEGIKDFFYEETLEE